MPIQQITSTDISNLPTSSVGATQLATGSVEGYLNTQGSAFGFRNRIINGAMVIDQRNAGASVSFSASASGYTLDRFLVENSTDGALTVQQSSTAPTGFSKSTLITITTADSSLGATQRCRILQAIEGFNTADLAFGTASASAVILSFWVRSSLTGTFGGALNNGNVDRSYPFTYTISSANTWEQKTVTVAGETSGTWNTGNTVGMYVQFGLGVGSTFSATAGSWATSQIMSATGATSVVGTNGATFYITGIQLEKGSVATPFEYRDYGRELQMCQRYYSKAIKGSYPGSFAAYAFSGASFTCSVQFPVTMRATPTFTFYFSGSVNTVGNVGTGGGVSITPAQNWWTADGVLGTNVTGSPLSTGSAYGFDYTANAEL